MENLKEITLKLDQRTVNYLVDEVRKKRIAGSATGFSDKFLIRLVEGLNKNTQTQVFRIREGNNPSVREFNNLT